MKGVSIKYSEQELEFIKSNCTLPRKELHAAFSERFNRDDVSMINIASLCTRRGWKTGRDGQLTRGLKSWNKGKTGYMGANSTSFKKGMRVHNHKPVGSERVCSKDGYILIKAAEPSKWVLKHRYTYEQHHGALSKSDVVTFIDGDITNCDITNLMVMTRRQLVYLNKNDMNGHTGEAKKSMLELANLNITLSEVRKKLNK